MERPQRSALVKIALLAFGWPLALNHFYAGSMGTAITAVIATWLAWISIIGIVIWIFPYFNAMFKALRAFEGDS